MKIWVEEKDGSVVCRHCGAVIMTAQENRDNAPQTAGLYTRSWAADSWEPSCPDNCKESEELI
jgi:hypothetical protein